jgi:hypothetical protein
MTVARRWIGATITIWLGASAGCVGDLIELSPTPNKTDGGAGTADLAQPGQEGGATLMPKFFPDIQGDIEGFGCTASSCHGGTQVPIEKSGPTTQADKDANYMGFHQRAMAGAMSLVLLKTLAGSGTSHSGGSFFTTTSDPKYVKWLAWINSGAPEQ